MSPNRTLQGVFIIFFFTLVVFFLQISALSAAPEMPQPDPALIQPFYPTPSHPATIPAFPEQSNLQGCPLDLPDELFHALTHACGASNGNNPNAHTGLRRSRCCPVLAAWLYSAYSATALRRAAKNRMSTQPYDLPVLPDDSETCVGNLENSLQEKGIQLLQPNETCDLVYCYCGIRLQPLSCPDAFSVSKEGKLLGGENVDRLEKDCLSSRKGFSSLAGCSNCLNSLYQLNEDKSVNSSKADRKSKMHNKDCEFMGLTWLLAKNRTAYIPTVTLVLRALMMSTNGSDPKSCNLNRDGMPLAVDSAELDNQSSSISLLSPVRLTIALGSLSLVFLFLLSYPSGFKFW
ncbi:uncharacterized GPI-anchored protein At4g28100-like [Macadamia integrifolia]|uniref:uncharacterized GPI-anchored protein At4g28100-like n=1 Tax=Macadamia integrifolia TaxID=60698 RepID=UPI001C4FDCAE|nr:uncharacterized GPI-anchored protein At4g28100-like [Macadamia integrifolia]